MKMGREMTIKVAAAPESEPSTPLAGALHHDMGLGDSGTNLLGQF